MNPSIFMQVVSQLLPQATVTQVESDEIADESRRKWLVTRIQANTCNLQRDPELKKCISRFVDQVQKASIAIAHPNSSGYVFGRKTVIRLFVDCFSELYDRRIRDRYFVDPKRPRGDDRSLQEILGGSARCDEIAQSFQRTWKRWDRFAESFSKENTYVQMDGDALEKLTWILEAIHDILERKGAVWCELCFRRVAIDSRYCRLHSPGSTSYVRARRKSLSSYENTRYMRSVLGLSHSSPNIVLLSQSSDVDARVGEGRAILVPPELKRLVQQTGTGEWRAVSKAWIEVVSELPLTSSVLRDQHIENATDWKDFVRRMRTGIENFDENNLHPFWVIVELYAAEEWSEIEAANTDGRERDTKATIRQMLAEGKEVKEIQELLGLSRATVFKHKKAIAEGA